MTKRLTAAERVASHNKGCKCDRCWEQEIKAAERDAVGDFARWFIRTYDTTCGLYDVEEICTRWQERDDDPTPHG